VFHDSFLLHHSTPSWIFLHTACFWSRYISPSQVTATACI
jgi:hypothetical protein